MKILKLTIYVLLTLIFNNLWAQNENKLPEIIPPPPEVTNFLRYGEIPINLSTGLPSIDISLYTISENELNVPISISYHASGIKVQDIASCVGLGWSLNAGGIISRTVFGKPDEHWFINPKFTKTAEEINAWKNAGESYSYNLLNLYEGPQDLMSDRYFYSFEGHSGIFRIDFITDIIKCIPYSPIKIEVKTDGAFHYYLKSASYNLASVKNNFIGKSTYYFKALIVKWGSKNLFSN